eukprot:7192818-Prymnesium_polylepis.1
MRLRLHALRDSHRSPMSAPHRNCGVLSLHGVHAVGTMLPIAGMRMEERYPSLVRGCDAEPDDATARESRTLLFTRFSRPPDRG